LNAALLMIMLTPFTLRAYTRFVSKHLVKFEDEELNILSFFCYFFSMCIPSNADWNLQDICDQTPFIFILNANRALVMIIWKGVFALVISCTKLTFLKCLGLCNWYKRKLVDMFQRKIFPVLQLIYSLDQFVCSPWFCLIALHI